MSFISSIFGDATKQVANEYRSYVDRINAWEEQFEKLSDEDLKSQTAEFKKRYQEGESLDDMLPEAFAAVREAAKRTMQKRHFDVQLMGGIALHQGKISEMKTGEGKTLVATLPAYLNALTGKGVHVVTVNDYLSRRDAVWMGQIYDALGLTTAVLNHDSSFVYDPTVKNEALDETRDTEGSFKVVHEFLRAVSRRQAYEADITYGTNNEFGFDYLRDNLVYHPSQMVQRKHHFAIVDEVDSILIDEARTPLIISAPDTDSTKLYQTFSRVILQLVENQDYNVDEKLKAVSITESGIEKVEKQLNLTNIYDEGGTRYVHHLEQALKAHVLFKRDRDYVLKDGEVIIVDEFTGRMMPGRRWSEGLHQAVEAKEGVKVEQESKTLGTITFQNYFRMYEKLAGMTGTAKTSAEEFHKVYNLDVALIPTNKLMIRTDHPDRIYKTEIGKFKAVIEEIKARHQKGQPVLVGTVSIEKNELLSKMLERDGIPHNVLNAKNHEKEAEIIAQAGHPGGVTIATNMAGRGVDIILGGNPPDEAAAQKVREAGGLHVIGTERHEARRIDDQLRGRSGRQGDPGSSQFFVSTEDELVRVFAGDRLKNIMERLGVGEDEAIENKIVSSAIQQAQARVEGHHFDTRKYVLEYDDVVNKHREGVYKLRREILNSQNNKDLVLSYLDDQIDQLVRFHTASEGEDNIKEILESLKAMAPFDGELEKELKNRLPDGMIEYLWDKTRELYEAREQEITPEQMRTLETLLLLRTIDDLWVDHISSMEHLRDSVRLRAYGQRDPLIEYKIEGQKMFDQLLDSIKSQVANAIFKVSIMREPQAVSVQEKKPEISSSIQLQQAPDHAVERAQVQTDSSTPKIGRNDPCPCGAINPATGQVYKYKKCGLINAPHHKR
ncbi:MAG: preprotein translocase subunit SecA [Candidatus Yanofskybacteria bacterium]|nr:preprotein translocase subunit SecA [Candidatus Yanofskybacteria bacterium]